MDLDKEIDLLNTSQREAVLHFGSPLLILAGPGSGKTRVITIKIAYLISEMDVFPNRILAITFTNKAAKEMKHRVQNLLGEKIRNTSPFVSTFHSYGAHILRRFHAEARLKKDFQIYDATDQLNLLKEANPKLDKKYHRAVLSGISKAKDYGLSMESSDEEIEHFVLEAEWYRNYEKLKDTTGNVDFGDLLLYPYKLIQQNEKVFLSIRKIWQWFFVDEYQDTNTVQNIWLQALCKNTGNITAVGDDDQSIYKFRGAVLENILKFESHFENTKVVKMEQNYRSTPEIVNLANFIIFQNSSRFNKKVFSNAESGAKPKVYYFNEEEEEEHTVVKEARESIMNNESVAIFYRTNSQSRSYEMALRKEHIPYQIVGAVGFFERAEVKDAISLARVYKNPFDLVSFLRIANKPVRGIGKTSLSRIVKEMEHKKTWYDAWRTHIHLINARARSSFQFLEEILQVENPLDTELRTSHQTHEAVEIDKVIRYLLERTGLWEHYETEDKDTGTDRISNLEELLNFASSYQNTEDGWVQFFEQVSLNEGIQDEQKQGQYNNAVQLITLHRSKGLEFSKVIICGVEDGLIPMLSGEESYLSEMEEERRLFYVGVTRAKNTLVMTYSKLRKRFGSWRDMEISPFISELDLKLVEFCQLGEQNELIGFMWKKGDRVEHKVYGRGHIIDVKHKSSNQLIHVEFTSGYEASFIPKYTKEIALVKE